jgi:tetratricopeptide (TPR) repeat protein
MADRRKLESWKDVAAFLRRDESTVRRWERTRGLPVHRVPGGARSTVFAYTDEIMAWLEGGRANGNERASTVNGRVSTVESEAAGFATQSSRHRRAMVLAASFVVLIVGSAGLGFVMWRQRSVRAESRLAEEAYRKGRLFLNQRNADSFKQAAASFHEALAHDPKSAEAYAGLADAYTVLGMGLGAPPAEALPQARAAVSKALDLDPTLADAHTSLAAIKALYDWDWPSADREFARALQLNANYALGHYWRGSFYFAPLGRFEEAIAEIKRAQILEPRAAYIVTGLGQVHYFARQFDRAIEQARTAVDLDRSFVPAKILLEYSYREKNLLAEAAAVRQANAGPLAALSLLPILRTSGYKVVVGHEAHVAEQDRTGPYVSPYWLAYYYAVSGERDLAIAWLERAYQQHHPALIFLGVEPVFDDLRVNPWLREVKQRVGVPVEPLVPRR